VRNRAFSIVELVVVIAMTAALIGLLAPALSRAASGSRSGRCQSNLRQMAVAAHNYAAIYDVYPAAIRYEQVNGVLHNIAWDWVTTFSHHVVGPGALWSFTGNPNEVHQCPEFHGVSTFGEPFTGYNYNTTYIGGESPFPQTGWTPMRRGVSPHACSQASRCAMFGDGGWKLGANKYMRAPMNSEGSLNVVYSGGQAFRHSRATNIAFVDGHIGTAGTPHKGNLATPALLEQTMDYPGNGFLSDDDDAYDPR
jgi:prepilin-type processing-associated H-X9-DG protein